MLHYIVYIRRSFKNSIMYVLYEIVLSNIKEFTFSEALAAE